MAQIPHTPAGLVGLRSYATGTGKFISRMDARSHVMDAIEDPYPSNRDVRCLPLSLARAVIDDAPHRL
jgi:hypothetical protein